MGHWALVKLAISVASRGGWRDALIGHADRCPSCRRWLAGREEARKALIQAEDAGRREDLWPRLERVLNAKSAASEKSSAARAPALRRRTSFWRWAAAAGGIGVAAAIVFFLGSHSLRPGPEPKIPVAPASDSLRILSASVAGRPAEMYVVEALEDRMILVWVERKEKEGERS